MNLWGEHREEEEVESLKSTVDEILICFSSTYTSNRHKFSKDSRCAVLKCLVTGTWSAVSDFIELENKTSDETLRKRVVKCMDCLQNYWRVYTDIYSRAEYIELIGKDPYVQRRYDFQFSIFDFRFSIFDFRFSICQFVELSILIFSTFHNFTISGFGIPCGPKRFQSSGFF